MSTVPSSGPENVTRNELISRLRQELLRFTDDETCVCKAVAERGVFCQGFHRYDEKTLRERYWWIVRRRPDITREELEKIANDWQLAQQEVREVPLACDVQTKARDTCNGWQDFTDDQLARFYQEITGRQVQIS